MDEISPARRLQAALRGAVVTTITPFTEREGSVNAQALRELVGRLVEDGIQTLIPCGNTGEFHSLTFEEWCDVVSVTVQEAGSRANVIPAVGGPIATAVAATEQARAAGATGVMILPLHHTYLTDRGIVDYYERVLSVGLPAIGYLRDRTTYDRIAPLIDHPLLVGAKWAVPDVAQFSNVRAATEDSDFVWSCGLAEQWAPMFWLAGASGFTSGLGNFSPRTAIAMHDALAAGDWEGAMAIRDATAAFETFRARYDSGYNVVAVKDAVVATGIQAGPTRPPLGPIHEADRGDFAIAVESILAAGTTSTRT